MHIDDYRHGRMVIDGDTETKDLIITAEGIHRHWWRNEGHVLAPDDLDTVWHQKPRLLVVGTGSTGRMRADASLAAEAARRGVMIEMMPTAQAAERFNELVGEGAADVAGAFHLTC